MDRREDDSGGNIITLVSSRLTAPLQPVQRECVLQPTEINHRRLRFLWPTIARATEINVVKDELNSFVYVK